MITKKDLKGLSKQELKEMLCLASQWCEECGLVLEFKDCSMEFAGQEIEPIVDVPSIEDEVESVTFNRGKQEDSADGIESLEDETLPFSFDPYEDYDRSDLICELEIAEEKNGYLESDNEDLKTAIRVLVDLYAGERTYRGDSYE